MWPGGFIIAALVLSVFAAAFAPGAPLLAVPLFLVLLAIGWINSRSRERRGVEGVRGLRGQAQAAHEASTEVQFTDRDKRSLHTP
jgi:hypothetical protein